MIKFPIIKGSSKKVRSKITEEERWDNRGDNGNGKTNINYRRNGFVSKFAAEYFVKRGYEVSVLNRGSRPQVSGVE